MLGPVNVISQAGTCWLPFYRLQDICLSLAIQKLLNRVSLAYPLPWEFDLLSEYEKNTKKAPGSLHGAFFVFNAWQCPTFTWGDPTLSSALCVFTSEFEMESGGTHTLWPPGKRAAWMNNHPDELGSDKDGATEVPAYQSSWVLYDQASRAISTG